MQYDHDYFSLALSLAFVLVEIYFLDFILLQLQFLSITPDYVNLTMLTLEQKLLILIYV